MIETIRIGTIKWHHVINPTEEDLQYLQDSFHFHELDIEDCRSILNQRPKIDSYDDYYFLILHFPYFDKSNQILRTREEKIFWGEDYVITIGRPEWLISEKFSEVRKQIENDIDLEIGTSDALLYFILQFLMKTTYGILRRVSDHVESAGRYLFSRKSIKLIENLSVTRKNVILLNTIFKPQLPLFNRFESGKIEGFADDMEDYWGNILDGYQKMWDLTEDYSELIEGYSKTFDSLQANRTNEIMKTLTLISSILLPLTFITSLYGMNVHLPFENNAMAFGLLVVIMIALIAIMLFYFRRKRWM